MASGSSRIDFLWSPGHFLSPKFRLCSEKPTFSTATGIITIYLSLRLLVITGVAVEKLARYEFAEFASRQEALQTIFPSPLDIFYHPIFDFFQMNRLFQQPQDFPTPIQLFARNRPRIASGWPRRHSKAHSSQP